MRSNTLVFAVLSLTGLSSATYGYGYGYGHSSETPSEYETKPWPTYGHDHPSATLSPYPTLTYPETEVTPTLRPTSSEEGGSSFYPTLPVPTSSEEGASSYTPSYTPSISYSPYPTSEVETVEPTPSYTPSVPTYAPSIPPPATTSEAEGVPTYGSSFYPVPVPTSEAEGVPTLAPYPTNGTIITSKLPLSPSATPIASPSGIVPVSGASIREWTAGSVVIGAIGIAFAML